MTKEPYITKYLFSKANMNKFPLSGTFEISPVCNMDCKMCYVKKTKEEMKSIGEERTIDEWISLAREAKKEGMLFLLLTGGEPFLYKDFRRLYEELIDMGFMISINTNGTLIDEETIKWISKKPPFRINLTLYGGSNETYERLCNNKKGFTQVTNAVELLKKAGISIKLNASITPYNEDDIELMYEFAREHDVNIQATSYMFPPVRRDESMVGKGNRFTAKQAAINSVRIDKLKYTEEQFIKKAESMKKGILIREEKDDDCKILEGDKILCRAGKSSFWITWNGLMTPCGMMTGPSFNPFEEGFINSWNNIVQATDNIRTSTECSNCEHRKICCNCAAMSAAETGSFDKKPEYICEFTKKILEETEVEYKCMKNRYVKVGE